MAKKKGFSIHHKGERAICKGSPGGKGFGRSSSRKKMPTPGAKARRRRLCNLKKGQIRRRKMSAGIEKVLSLVQKRKGRTVG